MKYVVKLDKLTGTYTLYHVDSGESMAHYGNKVAADEAAARLNERTKNART